jgi:hypothetical protein
MANIELDGPNKKIKVDSGDLTLDVPGDIVLDADGGDVVFADGGTNLLKVTNSSSDVVLQPQVDTKDIVFKQYDGTVVATVEDNATFNIPASKLAIGGTAVTSTAAELNILDGVTATATELNLIDGVTATTAELNILDGVTATASELNLLDGGTSVGSSITVADADGFVVNDGGTMKTIPATDIKTYAGGGGLNFISSTTIGDGVANFYINNCFSSTYQNYMVVLQNVRADADCNLRMRFAASGTHVDDANYRFAGTGFDRGGSARTYSGHDNTSFNISNSLDGGDAASQHFGIIYFAAPNISSSRKRITGHYNNSHTSGNSVDTTYNFAGTFEKSSFAPDGLFFFPDSGSFRTGNVSEGHGLVKVYGISDS